MDGQVEFFTFGMFIIDEIEYVDGRKRAGNLIGGAGTYAAMGARLAAGEKNAHLVSWIIDCGRDFPASFASTIDSWRTNVVYRVDENRLTTRAWNGYGAGEHRDFKYLTPKIRIDEQSMSSAQVSARHFHMVCSSQRCTSLIDGINARRCGSDAVAHKFGVVFEPVSELCVPEQAGAMREAARQVTIISPNAEELAGFFISAEHLRSQTQMAQQIVDWGIGPNGEGALVVREGSGGCSVYNRAWSAHVPAYHRIESSGKVVDPTGGGNAFLGALTMSLGHMVHPDTAHVEESLDPMIERLRMCSSSAVQVFVAVLYASVAASFVIEQQGMPNLTNRLGEESRWNGELFDARLNSFIEREKNHLGDHLQIR